MKVGSLHRSELWANGGTPDIFLVKESSLICLLIIFLDSFLAMFHLGVPKI